MEIRSGIIFSILFAASFFILQDADSLTYNDNIGLTADTKELAVRDVVPMEKLSRVKRAFGGKEKINYTLVHISILGPAGWIPFVAAAVTDVIFHVTGWVVLGITYNFGESKTNPNKVRQKYLTSFFGPTAITTSALRAIRNPTYPLVWFSWMNLIFSNQEFTTLLNTLTVKKVADTMLNEPWIQIRAFRVINTLYFYCLGWGVFYVVFKWQKKAPIIVGKRKKRETVLGKTSLDNNILEADEIANTLDMVYTRILEKMERSRMDKSLNQEEQLLSNYYQANKYSTGLTPTDYPRAYGAYQYYLSYGGDQYLNFPLSMENVFGVSGIVVHVVHAICAAPMEIAGYAAYGFMYNSFFRTEIEDQDHRKFLDTFMGPNAIVSAMLTLVRNGVYTLAIRVFLDLIVPVTRDGTIRIFQTLTFDVIRKATFEEGFLHTRISRQLFETGLDMCAFAVFWIVTKYKEKYIDPPPPPTTTPAPVITNDTSTATTYNQHNRLTYVFQNNKQLPYDEYNYDHKKYFNPFVPDKKYLYTKSDNFKKPIQNKYNYYTTESQSSYENDAYYSQYILPNNYDKGYTGEENEEPVFQKYGESLVGNYYNKVY